MMLYRFVGDNTHAMSSGGRHRRNFPLNVVRAMIVRLAPARNICLPQLVPQHPRKQHAPQKARVLPGRKTDDLPCRKACVTDGSWCCSKKSGSPTETWSEGHECLAYPSSILTSVILW